MSKEAIALIGSVLLSFGFVGAMYLAIKGTVRVLGDTGEESTQHYMTKENCTAYAEGTFEDFLRCYNAREWTRDPRFPKSHFGKMEEDGLHFRDIVHASNICFDGVGMLFDAKEYHKFKVWEKEHTLKSEDKEIKGKEWK
jgi:hypothetical protein